MRDIQTLCALALFAACLSGCGVRGTLDRPPPLWGSERINPAGDAAPEETVVPKPPLPRDDISDQAHSLGTGLKPETSATDDNDLDLDPGYGVDVAD